MHVGHSVLLAPWKASTLPKVKHCYHSVNNNLLTAHGNSGTRAAGVDICTMLSTTYSNLVLRRRVTTHLLDM